MWWLLQLSGPVVQWIECEIPVLMIRVRISAGSQVNGKSDYTKGGLDFLFYSIRKLVCKIDIK